MPQLRWFVQLHDPELADAVTALRAHLSAGGLTDAGDVVDASCLAADAVLVWTDRPLPADLQAALLRLAVPVVLAGPTLEVGDCGHGTTLAQAAGLAPGRATGVHDVRVRAVVPSSLRLQDHGHSGWAHLGEHTHVVDRVLQIDTIDDDVTVLLTANIGLVAHPVAAWRPSTQILTWALGTRADAAGSRALTRLLALVLRQQLGLPAPAAVRVGLLGYGAIGHEHNRAVQYVDGLELSAVCDLSAERIAAAHALAPEARGYRDPAALVADDEVDLIVVSTPPSSHASWALAALEAGKHVIVEKPFAIRTQEADAVLALAAHHNKIAAVYQNRRFDADHVAIRRAVAAGRLGELFHLETFVGGYGHPCNLWHSDSAVSGGAFYDWGAHVLDQLLDLMPGPIAHVSAVEHKRRWLDVTNADHSRVTVAFTDGAEASFVYSDLAAALKPRWYVLGTTGAIVGQWRTERVVSRSDIGTLAEDVLSPADSPPVLDLHDADGSITRLATPPTAPYAFHVELADQVQLGLQPSVTGAQSRRVLAVMEAAHESAADAGRPVVPR